MRSKLMTAMGKMNGRELGKLWLKDMVTSLTKGTGVYTVDEFYSILNKTDHRNIHEFSKYREASGLLSYMAAISGWNSAMIRESVFKIEMLLGHVRLASVVDAAGQIITIERIHHDMEHGVSDEIWESEAILKEDSSELQESILGYRSRVEVLYDDFRYQIRTHLEISAAMKQIGENVQIPEIASIPHDTMPYVEVLNESLKDLEDPYREVFPEIDIDSLEPSQEEIDGWVKRISDFIS